MPKATRVEKTILPNGLTVVVERMPHYPSVTAGVWVKSGSRQETPSTNGASHFVEHLVFKGTPTRTYTDIYKSFDRMGGVLDAFTSREIMGFYFRVQKAHFPEAFEVLGDMLVNASFPENELERERGVILEEIKMVNDTPSDLVGDLFLARAYPGHPLGRPVQGTEGSVSAMTRASVMRHYRNMMQPQNMVVTATGDTTLKETRELVAGLLGGLRNKALKPLKVPSFKGGQDVFKRNHLEQAQIVMGFGAEPASGPNRHVLMVLANCLGGTMSSRLFTEIREKRGLVYSISAEHLGFTDTGLLSVQAATSHTKAEATVRETIDVLKDVIENGLSEEEIEIAKDNLVGGLILSLESAAARMGRLARNELYYAEQRPAREMIDGIGRVTAKRAANQARKLFRADNALVCVMGRSSTLKRDVLSPLAGRT
jgi:predicted Zn-dependent peptidase